MSIAVFAFTVVVALLSWYGSFVSSLPSAVSVPEGEFGTELATSTSVAALPASAPVFLSLPTVGISAPFSAPLGLQANNEIAVPEGYEEVGYYQYGPTPGELGPAVVLGHVDSYRGPAVFYGLGGLATGDPVFIERADGVVAEFVVTALERHEQAGFPTELVYGDIDHAGLRLITCSGTYNRAAERYTHNLIVFAELVDTSTTTLSRS